MTDNPIQTNRLKLVSMSSHVIEALLRDDRRKAAELGGFAIPDSMLFKQSTLKRRLRQLDENPTIQPWLLRAIVLRESNEVCGRVGFHAPPGSEELRDIVPDGVELGYAVAEPFRRRGIAKEAVIGLIHWAWAHHSQRVFVLSISPKNTASLAMARSLEFKKIGSHDDPSDGIELYFARRLEFWPKEWENFKTC